MRRQLFVAIALVLVPARAHAEDDEDDEQMVIVETPAAEAPPEAPPVMIVTPASPAKRYTDVSYASQTLLLDGAATTLFAFGVTTDTPTLPGLGILTYAFGPPIAHFAHGNVGKGFADAGIRVVSPFLFALPGLMLAVATTSRSDREERETAMDVAGYTGMALGAAFAMAVDALVLAKERVREDHAYMRDDARARSWRGHIAHAEARRVQGRRHDARSEEPGAREETADEGPADPKGPAR